MIYCVTCKREMECFKNGVGIDFAHFHVYPSDVFKCPSCGMMIAKTLTSPIYDKAYSTQSAYVTDRRAAERSPENAEVLRPEKQFKVS